MSQFLPEVRDAISASAITSAACSSPHCFSVEPSSTKRTGLRSDVGPWWVASMVISYPSSCDLLSFSAMR